MKIYKYIYFNRSLSNKNIKLYAVLIIFIFIYIPYIFTFILNRYDNYLKSYNELNNIQLYFKICNNLKLLNKIKFNKLQNPKVSIITSVFNRENYILRFLRSVQNQFFDDIEIIIVDDYSKDNSTILIDEYKKFDERIILLKHKKNKGTLISRNNGILFSKGEYIIIPDIDDIFSENILYNCYQKAKLNDYEMIRFNIYRDKTRNIFFREIVNGLKSEPIYQPKLSTYLFYGLGFLKQIDFNLSNKFIKREAYIRALDYINKFYLNQYMIDLEDGIMNFILYRTVKSFYFYKTIGYYYIQNEKSITIKKNKNYDNKIKFIFLHLILVFEYTKNNKCEKKMFINIFNRFYRYLKKDFNLISKNFKFYNELINIFLKCKFINKKIRIFLNNMKKILNNKKN